MKNFSSSPLHSSSPTPNHIRERNNRKYGLLSAVPWRFSLRGYGFCMATLFFFCFGSLFYQLNGGPPKILLDIRQYLGKNFFFLFFFFFSSSAGSKRVIIRGTESCAARLDVLPSVGRAEGRFIQKMERGGSEARTFSVPAG